MTFLPIVDRELRVASRKRSTLWTRFFIALVAMIVFFAMVVSAQPSMGAANLGHSLFNALSILSFAYALLVGVFLTADCLSSERREGTLGLLFLTDLKGYDVVFGKIVATSLASFYGLLAVFPILALPLLLGGVTGGEFWRMISVLVLTLIFSLTIGAAVSVIARDEWQAMVATFLVLLSFTGIIPAIWGLVHYGLNSPLPAEPFMAASPGYAMSCSFDDEFRRAGGAERFWRSMGTLSGISFFCVGAASLFLPRSWQSRSDVKQIKTPLREQKTSRRIALVNESPFYWLTTRSSAPIVLFWGLFVVGFSTLAGILYEANNKKSINGWQFVVAVYGAYGLHFLVKVYMAITACRRLHSDTTTGALELILATPLPVSEIVESQKRALWKCFFVPIAMLAAYNICLLLVQIKFEPEKELTTMFALIAFGGTATLFADFFALVRVGMWQALVTRRFGIAALGTIARVLGPAWLTVAFFVFFSMVGRVSFGGFLGFAIVFYVFSLLLSGIIGSQTERKLLNRFRAAAAGQVRGYKPAPHQPHDSFWLQPLPGRRDSDAN